ncbi:MAG: hypothetical protein IKQ67_01785 [Candidatus Methanomethylophilaceae archaeon]|nr:hypothetical protein [Candidatus Methanomethylophilaceae archaeon]
MDKAPLMEFIGQMNHRHTMDMMEDMVSFLSEEQFSDCLRRSFKRICDENRDVENAICKVIGNVQFDIESSYYDDENEASIDDVAGLIKDRFGFVNVMFKAGLRDEAVDFCRCIADGLDRVSINPYYVNARDVVSSQRDDLRQLIEKGECEKWFSQRGL